MARTDSSSQPPLRNLRRTLVANRGEIAVRLMRTLRDLGIESVAVYAEDDATSAHVRAADFAMPLSGVGAASYLGQSQLLDVAIKTKCDSVLPGYGFLSENHEFATACKANGLCFVGPAPEAIEQMGDKLRARQLMAAAGVPIVPGGPAGNLTEAINAANQIGYPVLLKAANGGGGKGMRLVDDDSSMASAYEQARGEARRAFGSDVVYVEKAISGPRHVEIQVLADQHGNAVHLFERDCSVQRRHQKVIEESPSPQLRSETLEAMTGAALAAVRAVNYHSVGTLEFLVDDNQHFYFLEMNTRLQVEHTVTELVTGVDLVEQMLLVASGEPLELRQEGLSRRGAAIQCRLYAEDPENGFLPSTGDVTQLQQPGGPFVRVDSCLREGQRVGSEYDPLLAKVCTWAPTRAQALRRMSRALGEMRLSGPTTNLEFLQRALVCPAFESGQYDTAMIASHPELTSPSKTLQPELAAAAVSAVDAVVRRTNRRSPGRTKAQASTKTLDGSNESPNWVWGRRSSWSGRV